MAFDINDTYTGNGGAIVPPTSWPASIFKFDSSSFYNWEQDNLPLYDIEDRSNFIFGRLGFPTSSIPGVSFVLSGSNPNNIPNVFTTVPDLVNAIPEVVSFPIQIELCKFGRLGNLDLNNIKFTKNGALEFINRCYGRSVQASAIVNGLTTIDNQIFVSAVSSLDLKNTLIQTSTVYLGTRLLSGTSDPSFNTTNRVFVSKPGGSKTDRMTVVVNSTTLMSSSTNIFNFDTATIFGSSMDNSISNGDVLPVYGVDNSTEIKRTSAATNDPVDIFVYGNYFPEIRVENCDGPIYLRGICVDGGDINVHIHNVGFDILNSDVVIENCAAMRCIEAGFKATNSKINFARGVIGYRNYNLTSPGNRANLDEGAGAKIVNSELTLSSNTNYATNDDIILAFNRNSIGIDLYQSVIKGGYPRTSVSVLGSTLWLQSYYNNKFGIRLNNSTLNFEGRPDIFCNAIGFNSVNSTSYLNEFGIDKQKNQGMQLNNSFVYYNANLSSFALATGDFQQFHMELNGQNIVGKNSTIAPIRTSNMPAAFGRFYSLSSHAISVGDNNAGVQHLIPAIDLFNSYAEFVHLNGTTFEWNKGSPRGYDNSIYGVAISARKSSNIVCRGSGLYSTFILGPQSFGSQRFNAATYVGEDSSIEFTGPTKIAQFGVDCLAENNSLISFNPPRLESGSVDASAWNLLDPTNHTKVELHSTRACLVANNNSTIDMRDLGDVNTAWAGSPELTNSDFANFPYSNNQFVYSGFIQFYPNPQDSAHASSTVTNQVQTGNILLANNQGDISNGGVCVRATGDSVVKVRNTNFPMGVNNQRGSFYDSTLPNHQLFIWNIADSSKLFASYLSVSGMYPSSTGYVGPSCVYSNNGAVANFAPTSTPDSGSQSILDLFGGSSLARPGSTQINYGPFRLYLSPFTLAKSLNYDVTQDNIVYQTFAQGYNPSANVVVPGDDTIYGAASALSGFYYASSILEAKGQLRIYLDESAGNTFANSKHMSVDKSGTGRQVSIYRAKSVYTGEGFDAGAGNKGIGFFSANIFDLERDN